MCKHLRRANLALRPPARLARQHSPPLAPRRASCHGKHVAAAPAAVPRGQARLASPPHRAHAIILRQSCANETDRRRAPVTTTDPRATATAGGGAAAQGLRRATVGEGPHIGAVAWGGRGEGARRTLCGGSRGAPPPSRRVGGEADHLHRLLVLQSTRRATDPPPVCMHKQRGGCITCSRPRQALSCRKVLSGSISA